MIVLFLLLPTCVGFFVSLLTLIPPLRLAAQNSATFRLLLAFILGLTSFSLLYGIYTYVAAHASYHLGDMQYECQSCDHMVYVPPEFTDEEEAYKNAIIIEYWSRELLPPVFQSTCNTKNPTICRLADDISSRNLSRHISPKNAEKAQWNTFLSYFGSSFWGTISTIFFVHIFTRRHDIHSKIPLF